MPTTIFGITLPFSIDISNLLFQQKYPIDVFFAIDGWAMRHIWIPFLFDLLVFTNIFYTGLFIYFYETLEAIFYNIIQQYALMFPSSLPGSFVSWFGENSSDALIGDIIQGFIGIIMSWYVRKRLGLNDGPKSWNTKTFRQKCFRFFGLVFLSLLGTLSTISTELPEEYKRYTYLLEDQRFLIGIHKIPFGFWVCMMIELSILIYMYYNDMRDTLGYSENTIFKIDAMWSHIMVYFTFISLANSMFIFPTYFTLWITIPVIIVTYWFMLPNGV